MTEFGIVLVSTVVTQTQPEAGAAPPSAPVQAAPRVPGSVGTGTVQQTPNTVGPGPQSQPQGLGNMMWIIMLFAVLMLFLPALTGRKQKKQRETMMSGLKRNDRVQMAGGIRGTVVEIRDSEVVVRVDEVTNTRITFSKDAIQGVLREGKDSGKQNGDVEAKPAQEIAKT